MKGKRTKILFVAMAKSSHTHRWITLLNQLGKYDIALFSCYDLVKYNNRKYEKTISIYKLVDTLGFSFVFRAIPYLLKKFSWLKIDGNFLKTFYLKIVIKIFRPNIIHTLHTQNAGFLVKELKNAKRDDYNFPKWLHSVWGSDLYFWGKFPEKKEELSSTLSKIDYFLGEGKRDQILATELGFRGIFFDSMPASGGININYLEDRTDNQLPILKNSSSKITLKKCIKLVLYYFFRIERYNPNLHINIVNTLYIKQQKPSIRKEILIKGYNFGVGRCQVVLRALVRAKHYLKGYTINIFSCEIDFMLVRFYEIEIGIKINVIEFLSHYEMMKLFSCARIYIGSSISDGLPSALLEAMSMGTFPIQSDTSLANEWIIDGKTGFIVPPEDPETIAKAVIVSLKNDNLVDNAAIENINVIKNRALTPIILDKMQYIYDYIHQNSLDL